MTTITLKINERSKIGRTILTILKSFSSDDKDVMIVHPPNKETLKAIANVEAGKGITKTKSHADLMKKLNS